MYVKLFSIKEVGETIDRFGYECEIVKSEYLFSVRAENVIGIDESELKPKKERCYSFGYVDIESKCKLLETNNAREIANSHIVKKYYEVFLNEDARKLFPNVQRYYTDHDSYYKILKEIWKQIATQSYISESYREYMEGYAHENEISLEEIQNGIKRAVQ